MIEETDTAQRIGAAVKVARRQARLTQAQLGELAGLSDRTVRDIERGTGTPGLSAVLSTLNVLGLTLEVCR